MEDVNCAKDLKDLLERYRGGDAAAINEVFRLSQDRVLWIVRARLGKELRRKVESMDIVQDVLMDAYRNISKFDFASVGAFRSWLAKFATNRILKEWHYHTAERRDFHRELPFENMRSNESAIPFEVSDKGGLPTASQSVIRTEEFTRLKQALDKMPNDGRELIIAIKLEGRTYQELADEMSMSYDAVRMKANRAMDMLTEAFRDLESQGTRK